MFSRQKAFIMFLANTFKTLFVILTMMLRGPLILLAISMYLCKKAINCHQKRSCNYLKITSKMISNQHYSN